MTRIKTKSKFQYQVNVYDAWVKAGQPTRYSVRKETGINMGTITKYLVPGGVYMRDLPNAVLVLLDYFTQGTGFSISDYVYVAREDEAGNMVINKIEGLPIGLAF